MEALLFVHPTQLSWLWGQQAVFPHDTTNSHGPGENFGVGSTEYSYPV